MSVVTSLILLAEGAEEMETVITADILVRGGVDVTIAGLLDDKVVTCSRKVLIKPNVALADVADKLFDAIIIPGGLGGAKALSNSEKVKEILQKHESGGKIIAAICAGPTVLKNHHIALKKHVTCYPSLKDEMTKEYSYEDKHVVVDGKLVTSQGPGTTFQFALKLVELLIGADKANNLKKPMLVE